MLKHCKYFFSSLPALLRRKVGNGLKNAASCSSATMLLCCILLLSCEKTEIIRLNNGQTFCPLSFRSYPQQGPIDGCGLIFVPLYDPAFTTESDGVSMNVLLKKQNTPFVAADPTPNINTNAYHAYHLTHPASQYQLEFEKVIMTEGTRFSFYIGKTSARFGSALPYMGDIFNGIPAGPSPQHKWQIFIQREIQGTYTFGHVANGVPQIEQSNIPDFDRAEFNIQNQDGKCVLSAILYQLNDSIATLSTQNLGLNAIPDDYFGAFGFDILETLQTDCTDRPVQIKIKKYFYQGKNATDTYLDAFTCNTIWFK